MANDNGPDHIHTQQESENSLVTSYLQVRRAVGLLGVFLPALLLVFAATPDVDFMPSISEFYYTPIREALVATIGGIAVFLFAYKGFGPDTDRARLYRRERILTDRNVSFAAAVGAVGVAIFPVKSAFSAGVFPEPIAVQWFTETGSSWLHNGSALLFFVALTVFCLDNFQRLPVDQCADEARRAENAIYRNCGRVLLLCTVLIVLIGILNHFGAPGTKEGLKSARALFVVETVGLIAFSLSWLVKGKTLKPVVRRVETVQARRARQSV